MSIIGAVVICGGSEFAKLNGIHVKGMLTQLMAVLCKKSHAVSICLDGQMFPKFGEPFLQDPEPGRIQFPLPNNFKSAAEKGKMAGATADFYDCLFDVAERFNAVAKRRRGEGTPGLRLVVLSIGELNINSDSLKRWERLRDDKNGAIKVVYGGIVPSSPKKLEAKKFAAAMKLVPSYGGDFVTVSDTPTEELLQKVICDVTDHVTLAWDLPKIAGRKTAAAI